MASWKPSRLWVNRLSGRVKAYNNRIEKTGANIPKVNYSDIRGDLTNLKDLKRVYNRLGRFLRPGAEKVSTNKYGVSLTAYEKRELNYARRAANKNREFLRWAYIKGQRNTKHVDEFKYATLTKGWDDVKTKAEFDRLLRNYKIMSTKEFMDEKERVFRQHLLDSIAWMEFLPGYSYLTDKFRNAPYKLLIEAVSDEYTITNIDMNYYNIKGLAMDAGSDPGAVDYAERLVSEWRKKLGP